MEVMTARIVLFLLLLASLLQGVSSSDESVIVVANKVDQLNADFVDFLRSNRTVLVVEPSECEAYLTSAYIVFLGGPKAEGTGDIVERILSEEEKTEVSTRGGMIVRLNVWEYNQIVVVLAGPDREGTKKTCEENKKNVTSLFEGVDTVSQYVRSNSDQIVFLWPFPVLTTDLIAPYAPSFLSSKVTELPSLVPYALKEDSWFFFIDDAPYAKYAHPTRFFFFGTETRTQTLYEEEWWPVLNRKSLWADSRTYWESSSWVLNPGSHKPHSSQPRAITTPEPFSVTESARGLIINGWSAGQPNREDMAEDEEGMREALLSTRMTLQSADTVEKVHQTLQGWAQELTYGTLIIYVTAHGNEGYVCVGGKIFTDTDLAAALTRFDERVHIHVIIDACCGGAFISSLKKVSDTVITSTRMDKLAYSDWDPEEDANPDDGGSEFTSGFVVNLKELSRNSQGIEEWKKQAAEEGESWYTFLFVEAFKRTKELDVCAVKGLSSPQMWKRDSVSPSKKSGGCPCGH